MNENTEIANYAELTLKRGTDDAKQFSADYQAGITNVIAALRQDGVKVSATYFTMDAVDAVGGATGELAVIGTLGAASIAALGAWLGARMGRKVKLKVGEIEAEANSVEQLKEVLSIAPDVQRTREPKRINE